MRQHKQLVCLTSLILLSAFPIEVCSQHFWDEVWSQHHWDSRGSSWGEIRYPASPEESEKDDIILEGAITQKFASYELSPRTSINYFARLGFTFDTEKLDYNNRITLGPGFAIRRAFSLSGSISAGARYDIEQRTTGPTDERNHTGLILFTAWSNAWAIPVPCSFCPGRENSVSSGFTWGDLQYPSALTPEEENNLLLEGAIEQGMDLRQTDLGALNTFVAFDYKVDSEKLDWNNTLKGSLGIRLRMRASEHMSINIGVKLTREHRFVADNTWSDVVYFVNWGADWGSIF